MRTEINVITGKRIEVPLTQEEIDDAAARTAAELNDPARLQTIVDTAAKDSAKLDTVIQYLVTHTPEECTQYVQDSVTDLASAKAFLKKVAMVLSVLSKESLR